MRSFCYFIKLFLKLGHGTVIVVREREGGKEKERMRRRNRKIDERVDSVYIEKMVDRERERESDVYIEKERKEREKEKERG